MKYLDTFDFNRLIYFALTFICLTVIGTLSHEASHYIVAKQIGLSPQLHFASVSFDDKIDILNKESSNYSKYLISSIAGPLQTLLTGSFGFFLLFYRNRFKKIKFSKKDWISVFLSMFWLRQCFNLLNQIIASINQTSYPSGDEVFISQHFDFNPLTLNLITGIIGAVICGYIIFIIVPIKDRLNFILGGLVGSLIGFLIWLKFIGKIILP